MADHKEEWIHAGDAGDVYLQRSFGEGVPDHALLAELRFVSGSATFVLCEVYVADLRRIGEFVVAYADQMKDEAEEDRLESENEP